MQREMVKANLVVFIASFCSLVIELVAGRIMAPYVGVSLYTWTSIIGVVLAGISIGAYLGGLIADRFPRLSTLGWLLFLSGLGALSISPLINFLGRSEFHTTLMTRIVLMTALVFFLPSCLLGTISPVVVKLTLKSLKTTGNVVGKIYAFSTLGSILGTFTTGFLLIEWMGTRHVLLAAGMILIVCGPIFGGAFVKKRTIFLLFLILTLTLGIFYGKAFKPPLDEETYYFKESQYYTISLKKDRSDQEASLVTLYLDHLNHSRTDLKNPFRLEYRYIRVFEEMLRWQVDEKRPFRSLFIGGGGYTLPRYVELQYPNAKIEVVEIDPEVTRTAKTHMGIPPDTKIQTFNEDARWFVMNCEEKGRYDFIFLDAFSDLSVPYHLTTKEFAAQLKLLLKPDGLLLTNVIDNFNKGAFLPSYIRTLEEAFGKGYTHLISVSPIHDSLGTSNFIVVASIRKIDLNDFGDEIKKKSNQVMISHVMSQGQLQQYLKERGPVILTDDYVPVDNLIAPIFEELYGHQR
ncbi:MAG: fused MFS/spermidine synthase [Thermodesulfobacteriota bacterium]